MVLILAPFISVLYSSRIRSLKVICFFCFCRFLFWHRWSLKWLRVFFFLSWILELFSCFLERFLLCYSDDVRCVYVTTYYYSVLWISCLRIDFRLCRCALVRFGEKGWMHRVFEFSLYAFNRICSFSLWKSFWLCGKAIHRCCFRGCRDGVPDLLTG